MRLDEIYFNMNLDGIRRVITEASKTGITNNIASLELAFRSAYILIRDVETELDEMIKWNDPTNVMVAMRPLYVWVNTNFETGKVSGQGYAIRTNLKALSDTKPNLKNMISEFLSEIGFHTATRSRSESEKSTEDKFFQTVGFLKTLLKRVSPEFKDPNSAELIDRVRGKLGVLRSIKRSEIGVEPTNRPKVKDVSNDSNKLMSQQRQQLEMAINSLLKDAPKDLAANIRKNIERMDSNAKLKYVMSELSKAQ